MSSFPANCDVNALAGKFNPHSVSLMPYICSFSFLWQWQWVRHKDVKKYIYSQLSFPVLELLVRYMPSHAYSTADTPIQPAPHPASTNHTSPSSRFIPIAPSLLPTLSIPPPSPPPSNYFISSSSCCQGIPTHLTPLINANVKESHHKGLKLIKTHIPLIPPDFPLFHAVTSYTLCACINSASLHHIT